MTAADRGDPRTVKVNYIIKASCDPLIIIYSIFNHRYATYKVVVTAVTRLVRVRLFFIAYIMSDITGSYSWIQRPLQIEIAVLVPPHLRGIPSS
jgi:hypothetical protein